MKSAKLVSGLLLGLTLLASPAFAQRDVQRLNTEGIARAIGKQGDLTGEMCMSSEHFGQLALAI
jgi:hypothetical protein